MQQMSVTGCACCLLLSALSGPGQVLIDETVPSAALGADRAIHICLPASYTNNSVRRYPVLYLHDGQNVFSSAGTNAAFGWGNWNLDRTADELSRSGKMQEIIMVAVDNSRARMEEYSGKTGGTNGPTAFDKYTTFLIQELKPRIDGAYRTRTGPADTAVMGSSLGGLCSLALAWQHPEVFGGAGCLSSSFLVERTNFLKSVLGTYEGLPKPVRIYLDSGTVDYTGGDDGRGLTAEAAAELVRIGWTTNLLYWVDLHPLTTSELEKTGLRRDKWKEARISQHNEFYWRLRSWRPFCFLFPPGESSEGKHRSDD